MTGQVPPFSHIIAHLPPSVPFVAPEALERANGQPFQVRVGANESAFGISPLAREAMQEAIEKIGWYNDPDAHDLRAGISAFHGVETGEISIGAGIDELLGLVVRIFTEPGDAVVSSLGGYPTFHYHVEGFGGILHRVPYASDHEDLEGLVARAHEVGARLVYVANPDNPMGTWHEAGAVLRMISELPPDCVLILDEAYVEFAPAAVKWPIDTDCANVIRTRTFSKAHGMAGARVGYALASKQIVGAMDKVRNHFGVNRIAQAGALASLQDPEFVQGVVSNVQIGREDYYDLCTAVGVSAIPSGTNFVAMDLGSGSRARAVLQALIVRGVFVRMAGVEPLDRCIRVTVGTTSERAGFAKIFREVL